MLLLRRPASELRSPIHNHIHGHLTIHLSNMNFGNVTNTQRRHVSCCCCAYVLVNSCHVCTSVRAGELCMLMREETNSRAGRRANVRPGGNNIIYIENMLKS